jgi:hypothetical protein
MARSNPQLYSSSKPTTHLVNTLCIRIIALGSAERQECACPLGSAVQMPHAAAACIHDPSSSTERRACRPCTQARMASLLRRDYKYHLCSLSFEHVAYYCTYLTECSW